MITNVYRSGAVVATIPVDEGATCKRTIAGVDEITMDVVQSNGNLPILIGDYIIFEGNNYYLNRPSKVDKKSIVEYHFSLTFEADIYSLLNKLFQQPVTGRGDFGLVDTLEGFIDVLLANINGIESGWTKGAIPVTERKLMSFDGETCRAVLNRLADEFDVEFNVIGKQISFYDLYENATSLVFEHGQGKGLYELSRDNVDSNNTVTRGWFWGASKNIDYTYRDGETRLIFTNPATGTNRIDNFGDFSQAVEKQIIFEDVWPQFTGAITEVNNNVGAGLHTIVCPLIDFDVTLQMIEGVAPKVFFKSGDLQSQEFEIKAYDHATRTITLITYTDEFGQVWPNTSFYPRVGDLFTFLDLKMPDAYVTAAESALAVKAAEWMDYYSKLRVKYSLDLDPRYLRNNAITLHLGDVVGIVDTELSINKQIRITSIEKNIENPYKVKCEISNILEERWEKKISKQVLEALNNSKTATEKVSSTTMAIGSFFGRYFEVRGTAGNEYICAKMPFASVGEITAYTSGAEFPSMWDAMPLASATVKGGIKIGSGLSIDANGIVSVTSQGTIQSLSLVGTTLSISGGNSVTIPATYTDVMARAACAAIGTVYDSARLAGVLASTYTRRDVAETISQPWTFTGVAIDNSQHSALSINRSSISYTSQILCKTAGSTYWATGIVDAGTNEYKIQRNNGGWSDSVVINYATGLISLKTTTINGDLIVNSSNEVIKIAYPSGAAGFIRGYKNGITKWYVGAGDYSDDVHLATYASANLHLCTGGSTRLIINSAGNVGIGYTDLINYPAYRLDVNGDIRGNWHRSNINHGLYIHDALVYFTNNGMMPEISSGTNELNMTCGSATLYVNYTQGRIRTVPSKWIWNAGQGLNSYADMEMGHVMSWGNITATGEVTAYSSSDMRLKTNVTTISGMDVLRRLRPIEFDWNDTAIALNDNKRNNRHSASFPAQQYAEVLPWATHRGLGGYLTIDKDVLFPYIVAGMTYLDDKVIRVSDEVSLLKIKVKELETKLNMIA